jgi:hemerythrin superfamily protein
MKANDLLIKQHREVEALFERFEKAETSEKREIFEELAASLVGHDAIEREIFYPACEEELGEDDDVLGESLVEHGVVEFCLYGADEHRDSDDFDKYVTVLKEIVMHHVKEEEKELLPQVKRKLGAEMLEKLGTKMEARFEAALEEDFRKPLRENLDQVLAGRKKTQKKPARSAPAKKNGTRGHHAASRH